MFNFITNTKINTCFLCGIMGSQSELNAKLSSVPFQGV